MQRMNASKRKNPNQIYSFFSCKQYAQSCEEAMTAAKEYEERLQETIIYQLLVAICDIAVEQCHVKT